MDAPRIDWTRTVGDWSAFLLQQGWPLGVGDELRLQVLAERLQAQGMTVHTPAEAARWFGPLLVRTAEEQQRLPQLLQAWMPSSQLPEEPLPAALERIARAVVPAPAGDGTRVSSLISALILAVGAVALGIGISLGPAMLNGTPPVPVVNSAAAPASGPTPTIFSARRAAGAFLWSLPVLMAFGIRRLLRRRSAVLMRGLAPRDAPREALRLKLQDFALYTLQSLRAPVADLRRHRLVDAPWIDGARSALATLRQGGRVVLVQGKRRALPEYLMLVDLKGRDDILGALADLLVRLLEEGDVRVERFDFLGDPRHLRRIRYRDGLAEIVDSTDLQTLRATRPDHRLLVLSDAAGFADEHGLQVRSWVQALRQWNEVALLTPLPPGQWGPRERTLTRLGLCLAEATPEGLLSLARLFRSDRQGEQSLLASASTTATASGGRATRLDRHIGADPYRWLGDVPPSAVEQIQLMQELHEVLGDTALLYLQALAVFPVLQPRLTLALGRFLVDGHGLPVLSETTLARLCRLPWLRTARLPDWLRLLLLHELQRSPAGAGETSAEERVRAAWSVLLSPPTEGETQDLPLHVVRSVAPALPALVAKALAGSGRRGCGEALLLAFMNRESLPELAVALPEGNRPARLARHETVVDRWLLAGALPLAAAGAWLAPVVRDAPIAYRAQLVDVLWTLALTTGALCLISWYRRELRPLMVGRWAWLAAPPGGVTFWQVLPQTCAVTALGLAMAAAQLEAGTTSPPARLMLAIELVLWCFLSPGRAVLRWAPLLLLLQLDLSLGTRETWLPEFDLSLSSPYLALMFCAWLGLRYRWDDLRALLWLVLPLSVMDWRLDAATRIGHGIAIFLLTMLTARFVADATFRRRCLSVQRLDSKAVVVLLLPLSVMFVWNLPGLDALLGWWPGSLAMLAMFVAGLAAPNSGRWLWLLVPLWTLQLLATLNDWPWTWSRDYLLAEGWISTLGVRTAGSILSLVLAWCLGRLWRADVHPGWTLASLLLAFLAVSLRLSVSSFGGQRSVLSSLAFEFILVLAWVPACMVLRLRTLLIGLGTGMVLWTGSMVLHNTQSALPLAGEPPWLFLPPSLSPVSMLITLASGAWLIRHTQAAAGPWKPQPADAESPSIRLVLLDWGRYTRPAAVVALAVLLVPMALHQMRAGTPPATGPGPAQEAPDTSAERPPNGPAAAPAQGVEALASTTGAERPRVASPPQSTASRPPKQAVMAPKGRVPQRDRDSPDTVGGRSADPVPTTRTPPPAPTADERREAEQRALEQETGKPGNENRAPASRSPVEETRQRLEDAARAREDEKRLAVEEADFPAKK